MRNPFKPGTDQAFFWRHGGYSFDPLTETPEQGRKRCAINYADDESRGRAAGFSFEWQIDSDIDSSEWDDSPNPWSTWNCVCRDSSDRVVSSLCGIDFWGMVNHGATPIVGLLKQILLPMHCPIDGLQTR